MKSVRKSTIVFASVIMLSLMMSIILLGNRVEAKDLGNGSKSVEYLNIDQYYGSDYPKDVEGYVFAGWYEDEDCTISYVREEGNALEKYYAKYVPEAVLSVKVQNEKALWDTVLEDSSTGQIRFVTSVDSLNYKEVGLQIKSQIGNMNKTYSIRKVYTYLYEAGTTQESEAAKVLAAKVFGTEASKFFAAQNFKINLGQFDDNFTVTPYWITPDGVTVKGTERTRNMIENLEEGSYAEVNKRAYYTSNDIFQIATAMNQDGTKEKIWVGEEPATMTVLKNVVVSGQTSFEGTTIITNKAGKNVTIQTAEEWSPNSIGACLLFTNGKTLEIAGADNHESITIDGKNKKAPIRNNATLKAKNVTFMNGVRNDTNDQGKPIGVGGAINAADGVSTVITQCSFKNNIVNQNGGAIYVTKGSLQITDSEFSGNQATGEHGGAIFAGANAKVTLTVSNGQAALKSFSNNQAVAGSGGAIMVNGENAEANVTGYTFTGNDAKTMGGAIRFNEGTSFVVTKCTFKENESQAASSFGGGAICAVKDLHVNDCDFTANHAQWQGGAIYAKTGKLTIQDSNFDSNYAIKNHGGAIAVDTAAESSITNTAFYNNEAQTTSGGALYVTNTTLNAISCEFGKAGAPNKATANGGAIYVTGANTVLNMKVNENYTKKSFNYNTAKSGGAIMVMNGTVDVTGYTFSHNQATDMGGAVRFHSGITKNTAMKSCDFDNNQAKTGGAVYIQAGTTIKGGTFESNIATTSGGAVYATGGTKATDIVNTEFYANNATTNGGALYLEKTTVNVESCAFGKKDSPNTAEVDGGAIYAGISGNLQMTVDNSQYSHKSLSYNTANSGGAIMTKGATVSVNGYTFDNNIAATFGGAIRHTKDTDTSANTLNVELCKFEKNTATATGGADNTGGGAISVEAETTVSNCDFKDNSTKRYGGAIVANAKLTVQGGSFDNNSASGRGGAISAAATLEVNGGTYTLNSCGGYGGAISQEKGIGTVNNVTFNSNIAKQAGGAVGCVGATLALTNCDFTNNKATDGTKTTTGGVACVTSGGKISILISDGTKRSFEGNTDSANRTLYAKAKSIIEYSSLYEGVASGTDGTGENIGKVTEITQ